jgi:2-octaprenyl-6-methoxyphenol hydroxylase
LISAQGFAVVIKLGYASAAARRRSMASSSTSSSIPASARAPAKAKAPPSRRTGPRILIAGGGATGLCLAIALRRGLGDSAMVALAEPAPKPPAPGQTPLVDNRGWAVTAGSRRLLASIGAWERMAADAAPITRIRVTDSRTRDVVRPAFLNFDEPRDADDPFAHIVIAGTMVAALRETALEAGVTLLDRSVAGFTLETGRIAARLKGGDGDDLMPLDLLVAADGARSKLRDLAGIGYVRWDYPQSGIVASIRHERPHEGLATEHFMPSGPFAMLPLTNDGQGRHRSSIVWSERRENIGALMRLPEDMFLAEIEARFGLEFGEIALEDRPRPFPLAFGMARSFVGARLALLGDAAHQVHPIAGQGFNLGLKDVAALAEIIVDAARLGLDIGSATVLADYERARRADTVAMGFGMDALNRLFSNDMLPLRLARDLGLGIVDRIPALKHAFLRQAAGEMGHPSRLLRGESL